MKWLMKQVRENSTKRQQQSLEPQNELILSVSGGMSPRKTQNAPTFDIQVPVLEKMHSFPRTN